MKNLSLSSGCLPLSLTITLNAIWDCRIDSRSVESLGGAVSVLFTILFYIISSMLSLIKGIEFGEFPVVGLNRNRPCGLVDIIVVVQRNESTKDWVDSINKKYESGAAVKGRNVSAGAIFFWSSEYVLIIY